MGTAVEEHSSLLCLFTKESNHPKESFIEKTRCIIHSFNMPTWRIRIVLIINIINYDSYLFLSETWFYSLKSLPLFHFLQVSLELSLINSKDLLVNQ